MDESKAPMASDVTPFIHFPDGRLLHPAQPRPVDDSLLEIGASLLRAAREAQAYGLAAAHIGRMEAVAIVSLGDPSTRDYRLLYNPRILATQGPEVSGKEGSVSMPGIEVDVMRPQSARIGYDDETGNTVELDLTGFAARIALHEIDQVNGVFFLSRVSRLKRDSAIKRFAKLGRRMG
jgi:peptide deformylase